MDGPIRCFMSDVFSMFHVTMGLFFFSWAGGSEEGSNTVESEGCRVRGYW